MVSHPLFRIVCLALAALSMAASSFAQASDYENLEKRIKALEKKNARASNSSKDQRDVRSFLNTQVQLGGFFETALVSFSQSNRPTQLQVANNILGLNLAADFNDDLHFVTQFLNYVYIPIQNPNSDPNAAGSGLPGQAEFGTYQIQSLLTQGYVEWSKSEAFNLSGGMGYAPYGIAIQNLEPVLFVRRGGPQIRRTSDLVFPVWEGVNVHGAFALPGSRWGYNAYTFAPMTNSRIPGLGSRVWWRSGEERVTLGLSSQVFKRNQLTELNCGVDARLHAGPWTFTHETSKSSGGGPQPWSTYLQTEYELDNQSWILYAFGDFLDNPLNITENRSTLSDPFQKWEYGGGVNWLPTSYTRFRLGLLFANYVGSTAQPQGQTRDYWSVDASAGVAF